MVPVILGVHGLVGVWSMQYLVSLHPVPGKGSEHVIVTIASERYQFSCPWGSERVCEVIGGVLSIVTEAELVLSVQPALSVE